jgi:hypothetical protein
MVDGISGSLPPLPLILWETPPGLELALAQEGVPFRRVRKPVPLAFQAGRFVLFDSKAVSRKQVLAWMSSHHLAIDIDLFRHGEAIDPFQALIDTEGAPATWSIEGLTVVERVARHPKGVIRKRLVDRIRQSVLQAGGIWARLSPYPFPYQSAFNLRLDLDEREPEDFERFARARRPIDDCSTHFVSTAAYAGVSRVLDDLKGVDTQSHGHYHFVYREPETNRRNLERAHRLLADSGFAPEGFAGPHGRWNEGIDQVLEDLGYAYSSDFQLGYDDLPFFPWRGDRFSKVLQIPVHPLCEGVIFEAGGSARIVADHFVRVVRAQVASGDPAFVYGHPERRLGRYPEIVEELARAVGGEPLVWRTTLTEFARWWRWRGERRWSVVTRPEERFEVQFEDWEPTYPLAMELVRGNHRAVIPLNGPRTMLSLQDLAYERRPTRADLPEPTLFRGPQGIKAAVRRVLDWETVTPVDELPEGNVAARVKKRLRRWQERQRGI